ncbi:MAG: fused MFS/spermidine synthase [Planctomycetes bacterium]|nr:fused MFS/spermidine synthase [Planctomycetota bacterium]MCB9868404.1 fused MFS/spermidine synthase [Planctomycetota bacterium]
MTRTRGSTVLFGLFLLSGFSGLVYQVLWTRMFALVLGTTVYAVATVLGVFMGGLALGSHVFGRRADRAGSSGLRTYALLELAIAGWACAFPWLMRGSDALYRALWPLVEDSAVGQLGLRVSLVALVLLVPTTWMGGTLPVLSRALVRNRATSGRLVGRLYAVNTFGALCGCALTGFLLLERLGMRNTLWLAGGINLVVGVAALWLAKRSDSPTAAAAPQPQAPADAGPDEPFSLAQRRAVFAVFAASGALSLALEVLWTRALTYFVSVDTWAFSAMLTTFLLGIATGSWVMSAALPRLRDPLRALASVELALGAATAASIPLLRTLYTLTPDLGHGSLPAVLVTKLLASAWIMLLPALLMGAAFPLVGRICIAGTRDEGIGTSTGALFAGNTCGAILGSLGAGFALIPWLGIEGAVLLVAALYASLGLVVWVVRPCSRTVRWSSAAAGLLLLAGAFTFHGQPIVAFSPYLHPDAPLQRAEGWRLLYHRENAHACLAVLENHNGTRALNINGIVTAADNYLDMQVHRMLSHLPILLHPDPHRVLVVGFGMGSTVWGCCQHPLDVEVVELLRDERRTAHYFSAINHGVLDRSLRTLRFRHGDGRNHLLATRERYDVVSFNAIHPRFSANLYTREFYQLCRARLTESGVVCAWMTQNSLTDREWRMLCRSFVEVFPHATLWYCNPEHYCLIGHCSPPEVDLTTWRRRSAQSTVAADLRDSNLANPEVLLGRFLFGGDALRRYVAGAPLNTDDRPRIEFSLEDKHDERRIAEELAAAQQDVAALLPRACEADRTALRRRQAATRHLMSGQIDFWYPRGSTRAAARASSETALRRALALFPDCEDIRRNLQAHDALRASYTARATAQPTDALAHRELGRIALERAELDAARTHLTTAHRLRGDDPETLRLLGLTLLFRGENALSGGTFDRLFTLLRFQMSPDNATAQYAAGIALQRLGHAAGEQWTEQAAKQLPGVAAWFDALQTLARGEGHR